MSDEKLKPTSATTSRRKHDCYDHHELVKDEKPFTCDGCQVYDCGPRFVCTLCDNQLHKGCAYPKPTTSDHEHFGCAVFKFVEFPSITLDANNHKVYERHCAACDKDICGFNYHCESLNISLHPHCQKLEKKMLIDDMVFDLKPRPPSGCEWCDYDNVQNKGWSYISSCNNYHFHVYCFMEMVMEFNMKHKDSGSESIDLNNLNRSKNNWTTSSGMEGLMLTDITDKFLLTLNTGDKIKMFFEVVTQQFMEKGKLAMKKVYKAAKAFGIKIKVSFYDRIANFMKDKARKMARKILVEEMTKIYGYSVLGRVEQNPNPSESPKRFFKSPKQNSKPPK